MGTAEPETSAADRAPARRDGTLQPFPGRFVPGVCFESGHCLWLLEFTSTPTRFGSYTELWLVTPDGERVLYTDPGAAAEEVQQYHDFDRTTGASLTCDTSPPRLAVSMEGADGTTVELTASVGLTLGTRALNAVIASTPRAIQRSRLGTAASTASLNLLTDANGLRVAGRTETGRRYRLDAERILRITDASATLDGADLGALRPPARPIEFGDARTTADALFVPGTLQLERFETESTGRGTERSG